MERVFTEVLDMSLTASVVILVVLAARYFLRKAPKGISYALWAVVLFRLLCPVSLTAPVSVLEISQPKVTVMEGGASSVSYLPELPPAVPVAEPELPAIQNVELAAGPQTKQAAGADWQALAVWGWVLGAMAMALHGLLSYLRLSHRLVGATPAGSQVYLADHIPTPFVMGLWKPKIYLPSDTPEGERPYILAHERHHIRRLDHIFKLLAYGALCLHWFNPLVWAAFFLAGKDMEMSCDEAVIRKLGPEIRADYAQSLLRLATNRRILVGIPLAFGEGDTKGRVKHMVNWKKPKIWAVICSILLCAAVLISCAVNPDKEEPAAGEAGNTEPTEVSEPPVETAQGGDAVTMGLHIPWDTIAVENESRVWQFFPVEPIPGKVSDQPVTTELLGGVRAYDTPDIGLQDMSAWLQAVGVPQVVSGGYDYMASSSDSADLEVSFIDAGGRESKHYYFIQGASVFELWFDTDRLDDMTQAAMLESVYFAPDATIERELPVLRESEAMKDMAD